MFLNFFHQLEICTKYVYKGMIRCLGFVQKNSKGKRESGEKR